MLEGVGNKLGAHVICQQPADDPVRVEVDDHREVEPTAGSWNEGDVAGPDLIGFLGKGLVEQQIQGGFVCPAIASFWHVGLGLDGFEAAFHHDSADTRGGADEALIGKVRPDPAVAVTAAVTLENDFDDIANFLVRALSGGRFGGVVVTAARNSEGGTDRTDAMASSLVNVVDHLPELNWGLVPRMTAAFLKCHSPV